MTATDGVTADSIKDTITQAMKDAMRAQAKERLGVIRLIQAAFKQIEVDQRIAIDDQIALSILDKMIKQRRESIQQYQQANRADLADKEIAEINIIQEFMPAALDEAEVNKFVAAAIAQSGAMTMRDMAAVMALLRPDLQGRADMAKVSALVKAELSKHA